MQRKERRAKGKKEKVREAIRKMKVMREPRKIEVRR